MRPCVNAALAELFLEDLVFGA
jgi:hypothetical protein